MHNGLQRAQGVLLFLVLAVNFAWVRILCSYTLAARSYALLVSTIYVLHISMMKVEHWKVVHRVSILW